MPATLTEVQGLIQQAFPNADVSEVEEEDHYISGTIRSEEFRGMDLSERLR